MSRASLTRSVLCLSAAVVVLGLSACASRSKYPGYSTVASDLTPDMLTLTNRPIDAQNRMAVTTNENWRMFWSDLSRAALLDRPSRLTPTMIPH